MSTARGGVGVALGTGELVWVDGSGSVARHALSDMPSDNSLWGSLESGLRLLRESAAGDRLTIALLAPLVEVRAIPLPPLAEDEATLLLSRSGGKYFLGARGPQVVGVGPDQGGDARMAAAAPARLVSAIEAAALAAGWRDVHLVPAEAAWAVAATLFWPGRKRERSAVVVADSVGTVIIDSEGGVLHGVRRFRTDGKDLAAIAQILSAMEGTPAIAVIGAETARTELTATLSLSRITVQPVPSEWASRVADPSALAAECASLVRSLRLASVASRLAVRGRIRRRAWWITGVAAAIALTAAGAELWGTHREIAAVEASRDAIRPAVEATLVGRSSMEDAYRRLTEVVAVQRTAPRWSGILADMASRVPEEAHLTGFRARGDSLIIDGFAVSAARVFEALVEAPELVQVRASAPVRRQAPDGEAMERFAIGALRRTSTTPEGK